MIIIDFEKMKELLENILSEIDIEIDEIDLYGYDIVENSLSMVHKPVYRFTSWFTSEPRFTGLHQSLQTQCI